MRVAIVCGRALSVFASAVNVYLCRDERLSQRRRHQCEGRARATFVVIVVWRIPSRELSTTVPTTGFVPKVTTKGRSVAVHEMQQPRQETEP